MPTKCSDLASELLGTVVLVDNDGLIVDLSPSAESLLGWSNSQLVGESINVLVPERIRKGHASSVASFLAAPTHRAMGQIIPVARHRDGRELQVEIELRPLIINDKPFIAALITDATADRNARLLSEANSRAAVGQAIKSPTGKFLEVNPAFCRLVGYEEVQLLDMKSQEIVHPDDRQIVASAIESLLVGDEPSTVIDRRIIRENGAEIWLRTFMTVIHGTSFGTDAILSQSVDVSMQKHLERSLERSNRELEEFAYVASHDLQAPVRNITALLDLLEEDLDPSVLNDEQREYFQMLRKVANQARRQIQGLLKMSRLQRANPKQVSVDIGEIVRVATEQLATDIKGAEAAISVQFPLRPVLGNPQQLVALFQNLLSNSIKYRRDGIPPQVHVGSLESETPGTCHFVVTDNGIGIAKKDHSRVFQIFKRLHAESDARYPGTGIGLALAAKIVELNRGTIWVESDGDGTGCTFHVVLPAAESAPSPNELRFAAGEA